MPFVQREASTSSTRFEVGSAPRSGHGKQRAEQMSKGQKVKSNHLRRQRADAELEELQARVDQIKTDTPIETFSQLPLSDRTLKGLKACHFLNPTQIQTLAIPPSLQHRDVLGSAKTGSGKTLAFLIPLLERLFLLKWGLMDGLGAVVISPTRELAVQTFNQLREIGKYHSFSAGLVIGGKPLKEERERLGRMNILVATPGRLLQHLDSTVGFESAGLKVLVLDEADRLLDLGFLASLRAIVSHFTVSTSSADARQTLLYSATQTADVATLAKLSLRDPLYISCNRAEEDGVVPSNLDQFYAVVNLPRKLDALWGFVKSHLKMKAVVFVTSGKQVRFIFETFRRLHPGLPVLHLHGKQKQPTRLSIFQRFSGSSTALLICTDVASRGLDFPSVDWVIQLDCPDDADTYIHRVGRTARYLSEGKALCLLCPSEEKGMLQNWGDKRLQVKKIRIKDRKMGDLRQQMQNFSFKDPEIKHLAQRAFISYVRSVHLQKDKIVFDISQLPMEEFAASLGLSGAPLIKLPTSGSLQSKVRVRGATQPTSLASESPDLGASSEDDLPEDVQETNATEEDDDEVFTIVRRDHELVDGDDIATVDENTLKPSDPALSSEEMSKRLQRSLVSKKHLVKTRAPGAKTIFDEEGNETTPYQIGAEAERGAADARDGYVEEERVRMKVADKVDREVARERRREKKRKRKEKEREAMAQDDSEDEGGGLAFIGEPMESDQDSGLDDGSSPAVASEPLEPSSKKARKDPDLADDEELALRLLRG